MHIKNQICIKKSEQKHRRFVDLKYQLTATRGKKAAGSGKGAKSHPERGSGEII